MSERRRMMMGAKLPYDAQIHYLQCTGTQYINLGFKPTNNIQIDAVFGRSNNNIRFDCGAENGWSSKIVRCIVIENDYLCWRNHYNNPTSASISSSYLIGDVRIVCNGRTATAYNLTNSSTVGSITNPTTTSFTADENFYVFGFGYQGGCSYSSAQNGLKLYSIKVVDNGVNLDLIPVRIGQVGYLYDKNSEQLFGNSGSGNFTLGHDVDPSVPYMKLEYIAGTGTQYLNTNIVSQIGDAISITLGTPNLAKNFLCGARKNNAGMNNSFFIYGKASNNNYVNFAMNDNYYSSNTNIQDNYIHIIEHKQDGGYIDGVKKVDVAVTESPSTRPYYIFTINDRDSGISEISSFRLYRFIYKRNDYTIMDLIPVSIYGIGCMYDKISGQVYRNIGSGSFTVGPEI